MAKKKKGSKSKQHTADLVGGMRQSNAQSKTPISSLYPKKFTVGNSRTSPARMQKGTHSPSKSKTPVKMLLAITDPGPQPTAPTPPTNPGSALPHPDNLLAERQLTYESYRIREGEDSGEWDQRGRSYEDDRGDYDNRVEAKTIRDEEISVYNSNLSNYNTSLATYNTNLANWNTATASRDDRQAKNTRKTTKYQQDLKKFFSSIGKNKNSKKSYNKTRGARGTTRNRLGGARG